MEKTLTTTEQNLAALNITEDEANSRQGSRNKLHSYNNNRRDSRRFKPRDNRHAISQQNKTERRQIDNPSAAKCYNCGNSWPHLNAPCPARGKQVAIAMDTLPKFAARPNNNNDHVPFIARENISEISTVAVAPPPRPLNPMTIFIRYIANTTNLQKCQKYIA